MRKFKIEKMPFGEPLYSKDNITINEGLTILVGCNGAGKTSLLHILRNELTRKEIPFYSFDNMSDGGNTERQKALNAQEINYLATLATSSEGEQIVCIINSLAKKIGSFITSNSKAKEIWLFFDAVDSGMSIDNIDDIKSFFRFIINHEKEKQIHIVCSANSYEMAREAPCFDVYEGKYVNFKTYDEYRDFVLKSKEIKNKRYERNA